MRSRLSKKLTRLVSLVAADSANISKSSLLGSSSSSSSPLLSPFPPSSSVRPSIAACFSSTAAAMRISSSTASASPVASASVAASAPQRPPRATFAARTGMRGSSSSSSPSRGAAASALLRSASIGSRQTLATSTPAPFSSSLSSLPPSVACAASSRRNSSSSAATSSSSSPHPPPLRTVPGIGAKAELLLAAAGIGTVADLVRAFEARAASSKPQMVSFLQDEVGIRHGRYANKIADHVADIHGETSREQEDAAKAADEGDSGSSAERRLRAAAADRRVTLCVEGNISAGKSSFLRFIADECVELQDVIEVVPEPVDKWQAVGPDRVNVLEQFYANPERYAYTFQNYVFVTRMMQERESAAGASPLRLLERSVFSDRMVFVRAVHEARWMSDMELDIYDSWFDPVVSALPALAPDGFIYLRATPGTCAARMGRRGRGEEGGVSLGYLEGLHEKHDAWLAEPSLLGLGAAGAGGAIGGGGREIRLSASAVGGGGGGRGADFLGAFAAPTSSPALALPPAVLSPDGRGMLSSSLLLPGNAPSSSPPGLLDMGSRVRVGGSGGGEGLGGSTRPSALDPAALIPEPPEIAGRVYYLDSARQAGLHAAVDRVPALLLDCDRDIDLKNDAEAKAHYGRQVAAYFGHVRRVRAARRAAAAASGAGGAGVVAPVSAAEAGKRATALAAAAEAMFGGGENGGVSGGVLRADPSMLQRVLREQQQSGGRRRASG